MFTMYTFYFGTSLFSWRGFLLFFSFFFLDGAHLLTATRSIVGSMRSVEDDGSESDLEKAIISL